EQLLAEGTFVHAVLKRDKGLLVATRPAEIRILDTGDTYRKGTGNRIGRKVARALDKYNRNRINPKFLAPDFARNAALIYISKVEGVRTHRQRNGTDAHIDKGLSSQCSALARVPLWIRIVNAEEQLPRVHFRQRHDERRPIGVAIDD